MISSSSPASRLVTGLLLLALCSTVWADTGAAAQWCDRTINVCVAVAVPGHVSLAGQTLVQNAPTSTPGSSTVTGSPSSFVDSTTSSFSIPGLSHKSSVTSISQTITSTSSAVSTSQPKGSSSVAAVVSTSSAAASSISHQAEPPSTASSVVQQATSSTLKPVTPKTSVHSSSAASSIKVSSASRQVITTQTAKHSQSDSTKSTGHSVSVASNLVQKVAAHATPTTTLWWTQTVSNPWWTQSGGPFDHASKRTRPTETHGASAQKSKRSASQTQRALPGRPFDMDDSVTSAYNWIYYTVVMPANLAWFAFGPDDARILLTPGTSNGNGSVGVDLRDSTLKVPNPLMIVETMAGSGLYQSVSNGSLTSVTDGTGDFAVVYLRQAMLNGSFVIPNLSSTSRLRKRDDATSNAAAGLQAYNYAFGAVAPSNTSDTGMQVSHWAGQGQFLLALGQLGGATGPLAAQELLSTGQVGTGTSSWRMIVIAHAFFMILAFSILLPLGIFCVRLELVQRRLKTWQTAHWMIQVGASLIAFVAFILGFVAAAGNRAVGAHQVLGCLIFVLLIAQVSLGAARKQLSKRLKQVSWLNGSHFVLAYILLFLAWINVGLGLELFGASKASIAAWYTVTGLLWACYIAVEIIGRHRKRRSTSAERALEEPWYGTGVGHVAEKDPYSQWQARSGQRGVNDFDQPEVSYLSNENDEDLLHRERTLKWRESDGADLGSRNNRAASDIVGGVRHWAASAKRILSGGYTRAAPDSPSKLRDTRPRNGQPEVLSTRAYDTRENASSIPFSREAQARASCTSITNVTPGGFGLVITNPSSNGCDSSHRPEDTDPFADTQRPNWTAAGAQRQRDYNGNRAQADRRAPIPGPMAQHASGHSSSFNIIPASLPVAQSSDDAAWDQDDGRRPLSPTRPGIAGVGAGSRAASGHLLGSPRTIDGTGLGYLVSGDHTAHQPSRHENPLSKDYCYHRVVHTQRTRHEVGRQPSSRKNIRDSQLSEYSTESAGNRTSISSEIVHAYSATEGASETISFSDTSIHETRIARQSRLEDYAPY